MSHSLKLVQKHYEELENYERQKKNERLIQRLKEDCAPGSSSRAARRKASSRRAGRRTARSRRRIACSMVTICNRPRPFAFDQIPGHKHGVQAQVPPCRKNPI